MPKKLSSFDTTKYFFDYFNLKDLTDLLQIQEIVDPVDPGKIEVGLHKKLALAVEKGTVLTDKTNGQRRRSVFKKLTRVR